jgi:hypothetical protein
MCIYPEKEFAMLPIVQKHKLIDHHSIVLDKIEGGYTYKNINGLSFNKLGIFVLNITKD